MEKIAVLGAGAMGKQIALQTALSGFEVTLNDTSADALEKARAFYDEYLDGRIAKGKLTPEKKKAALANLRFTTDLAAAVGDASIVIESIIENREAKLAVFRELDRHCRPDAILATNSSNICGSELAAVTKRSGHVINMHFFNPVLVMDLIELVATSVVPEEVVERALKFSKDIGRTPVLIRKEIPGFVVNRIFRALTREAILLYENGYASCADIDLAVTKALGHPMGPFTLMDMAGVDVTYMARKDEYDQTGVESAKPPRTLEEMYKSGAWGKKAGRGFYTYPRDEKK
ncbi:MAG: 3-hydroxyacyl-CoA dehydrogenase [Kaistia sp. SCN 65-12]|nr:MAG: 3-hydroxyacyl-CoA dehydrogenase [Kaistia sp. SCN 65-12]